MNSYSKNIQLYHFYLYPFVHVNVKNKVLLYNSLNGNFILEESKLICNIINDLLASYNKVIEINAETYTNQHINAFFNKIVNLGMGDVINASNSRKLPVQFSHEVKIQKGVDFLAERKDRSIGEDILSYMDEVILYLNGKCTLNCKSCEYGYKQINTCRKSNQEDFDLETLKSLLFDFDKIPISILHLSGGDVTKYGFFNDIHEILKTRTYKVIFHINGRSFVNSYSNFKTYSSSSIIFHISITEYSQVFLDELFILLQSNQYNYKLVFCIESEQEFIKVGEIISTGKLQEYEIKPLYNKDNLSFFEDNVYLSEEDLFEDKHCFNDILRKHDINTNFFGTLTIDSDGEVYSIINGSSLGNIYKNTIQEFIYSELIENQGWRLLRKNLEPCSRCCFNLLCPCINNYELFIGKINLCKIN